MLRAAPLGLVSSDGAVVIQVRFRRDSLSRMPSVMYLIKVLSEVQSSADGITTWRPEEMLQGLWAPAPAHAPSWV